jgi:hypothetical protein
VRPSHALLFPSLVAIAACSGSSKGGGDDGPTGDAGVEAPDGGQSSARDGSPAAASTEAGAPDAASGGATTVPAGTTGAAKFASQICAHEEQCALIDASASTCDSDYTAYYETADANPWAGTGTPPPLELYRADYVTELGACIASAGCGSPLGDIETDCNAELLTPSDAGTATIEPTRALATFCEAFAASACLAADAGAGECTSLFVLFNDQALRTATTCVSGADCSTVESCFPAAFTQP